MLFKDENLDELEVKCKAEREGGEDSEKAALARASYMTLGTSPRHGINERVPHAASPSELLPDADYAQRGDIVPGARTYVRWLAMIIKATYSSPIAVYDSDGA
jgi:hypothetical protein